MEVDAGGAGRTVDLLHEPDVPPGNLDAPPTGSIITSRSSQQRGEQLRIKDYLEGDGYVDVSDQKDRFYFKSIYVRQPGRRPDRGRYTLELPARRGRSGAGLET